MPRYIALLRAVNVGKRQVAMARLRELLEGELGYDDVATYIQSGNAFFTTPERSRKKLTEQLEKAIAKEFGFDVPVMLRTLAEVEAAVERNAFKGVKTNDDTRFCIVFTDKKLPAAVKLPHRSEDGRYEILAATKGEVFMVLHQDKGRPGNPAKLVEEHGLRGTSRFAHTTEKILAAAQKTAG